MAVKQPKMPELGSGNGKSQRNPYFLSAARETPSGRLVFSQPEVALYVRDIRGFLR